MSDFKQYAEIMEKMEGYINHVEKEAYQKGYNEAWASVGECEDRVAKQAYQKGLDDAWEAAKKIFGYEIDGGLPVDDLRSVFGFESGPFCTADILMTNTASEAIAKLKAYEEHQKADEIKVGDEVRNKNHNVKWTAVVVQIDGDTIYLMGNSGDVADYQSCYFEKTGRHFPQVAELLKAMNDEQRDCHTCKHKVASSIECVDCRSFGKWEPKEGAE